MVQKMRESRKPHNKIEKRSSSGASLYLVIACAFALIALIWGVFQLYLVMGGSREVRNAVDAGALNLSKRIFELRVPADPSYRDVADSNGQVGMSNINRVWGKAYLINANAQQMQADGQLGNSALGNADSAYQTAENINNSLFAEVSSRKNQGNYFNAIAGFKQATLLSGDTTVTKDTNNLTQTQENPLACIAMVDRGAESNLKFNPAQIPKVVTANGVSHGNNNYLQGYVPMHANNKSFNFTSYRPGEMPHLISQTVFDKFRADVAPVGSNALAIPNAFKIDGNVQANQGTLGAVACAVANPMRQYNLAIPFSYVVVYFVNRANWYVEGVKVNQTTYGNKPTPSVQGVKKKLLSKGGYLDGYANLGNEYTSGGSLWQMYTSLPGDHQTPMLKVLQRVQEISPNYTMTQLETLMAKTNFDPTAQLYFIYPSYTTPDYSDPTIMIASDKGPLPPWLQRIPLDGTQAPIGTETMTQNAPNTCYDVITGGPFSSDKHYTEVSGSINWTPGTGYGQCLGSLQMSRLTQIYFTGVPE
jgi:hypothetical protein